MTGDFVLRDDLPRGWERERTIILTRIAALQWLPVKDVGTTLLYRDRHAGKPALRQLVSEGLVTIEPFANGTVQDQPTVFLTQCGWEYALDQLVTFAEGTTWERLARQSVIATNGHATPPDRLAPDRPDVRRLLLSFHGFPEQDFFMGWATMWRPAFVREIRGLALPQPSYVAPLFAPNREILIFGECDNGCWSLDGFGRRMRLYAQLARRPKLVEEVFGYKTFQVWVTVADPEHRVPFIRMNELIDVARREGAAEFTSFTLHHWAVKEPDRAIWFTNGRKPLTLSQDRRDHPNRSSFEDLDERISITMSDAELGDHRRLGNTSPLIPPGS